MSGGNATTPAPRRVFLGWDRRPLEAAADWLLGQYEEDLSRCLVALPGARAGRALRQRLARRLGPAWLPPRIVTAGELTDELLEIRGEPAPRLLRTLAWAAALAAVPGDRLRALVPRPPHGEEVHAWLRLADEARRLFGEVTAEVRSFEEVARAAREVAGAREAARWDALALAQTTMAASLAEAGFVDPHLARLAALREGRVRQDRPVVLIGVADSNELLMRALSATRAPVTALVFAPEKLADSFDEYGRLQFGRWSDRDLDRPLAGWRVVGTPDDQARQVCIELARLSDRYTADDVTVGVADPEVAPHLVRRLESAGVHARDAAGTVLSRTAPIRLVDALARFLDEGDHPSYAALVRHPDLGGLWRSASIDAPSVPAAIDAWQRTHLPGRVGDHWPGSRAAEEARRVWNCLRDALGDLATDDRRPLTDWVAAMRAFLATVYAGSDAAAGGTPLREVLANLGEALAELEDVPASIAPHVRAADALRILSRVVSDRALPPEAAAPGSASIDLLGWLELPLDDAPIAIVTGFQDGFVPAAPRADAFLPNGLRRQLGLVDDRRRAARDAYSLELLAHARDELVLISGRRSAAGDPLLPSRLAFHARGEVLRDRVRRAFRTLPRRPELAREESIPARPLPRLQDRIALDSVRATAFRDFLQAPYLFYVRHVLRLETFDDSADELDAASFGTLAHAVLAAFGNDADIRDSADANEIRAFLDAELRRRVAEIHGADPLPAVALQTDQLGWRLQKFAERQAAHRRDGWRIAAVEWSATAPRDLLVGDTRVAVRGRIDRIDEHEKTGKWAILDYKTGETCKSPESAHRNKKSGEWLDLQLPLYAWIAEELVGDAEVPELGYAWLGKDESHVSIRFATELGEGVVREALDEARRILTQVLEGEVFEALPRGTRLDPTLAALCGTELLITDGDEGDEGEGA